MAKPKSRTPAAASAEISTLRDLEAQFIAFHKAHAPGTRIPGDLRRAVVGAIDSGLRPAQVRKACRLSSGQLLDWRRALAAAPTVLTVTDDGVPPAPGEESSPHSADPRSSFNFQFQVEGWVVGLSLDRVRCGGGN